MILDDEAPRTVDIVVDTTATGGSGSITLSNVPVPVTFAYLAEKLQEHGMLSITPSKDNMAEAHLTRSLDALCVHN